MKQDTISCSGTYLADSMPTRLGDIPFIIRARRVHADRTNGGFARALEADFE